MARKTTDKPWTLERVAEVWAKTFGETCDGELYILMFALGFCTPESMRQLNRQLRLWDVYDSPRLICSASDRLFAAARRIVQNGK